MSKKTKIIFFVLLVLFFPLGILMLVWPTSNPQGLQGIIAPAIIINLMWMYFAAVLIVNNRKITSFITGLVIVAVMVVIIATGFWV